MKHFLLKIAAVSLLASMCSMTVVADEIRLPDGSRWTGEVNDSVEIRFVEQSAELKIVGTITKMSKDYLVVDGTVGGKKQQKLIFIADVVSIDSAGGSDSSAGDSGAGAGSTLTSGSAGASAGSSKATSKEKGGNTQGVFLLPMHGGVGETFRHDEILMMGEHADKFGPGQIIILHIKSNGGLVLESDRINDAIHDVRRRHRVVAWVEKAISAGCSTAMACNEIYFMTTGTAGSVTTLSGGRSVDEASIAGAVEQFASFAEESGYSQHIARAMKLNKHMCSYDKDPETGECTFYGDMSGEFDLSDRNSNLTFNHDNALHCNFSKGTADSVEQLAELLALEDWKEVDDYGKRISKRWHDTFNRIAREMPMIGYRLSNPAGTDAESRISNQIVNLKKILTFQKQAPLVMAINYGVQDPYPIKRQIEELQHQLARMRDRGR